MNVNWTVCVHTQPLAGGRSQGSNTISCYISSLLSHLLSDYCLLEVVARKLRDDMTMSATLPLKYGSIMAVRSSNGEKEAACLNLRRSRSSTLCRGESEAGGGTLELAPRSKLVGAEAAGADRWWIQVGGR